MTRPAVPVGTLAALNAGPTQGHGVRPGKPISNGGQDSVQFSALVVALTGLAPMAASAVEMPSKEAEGALAAVSLAQVVGVPFQEQDVADEADGGIPASDPALAPLPLPPAATRGLERGFLTRLQRVVDRLTTEHGMDVEIVEGLRTPERQMELYAQGRTAPGPVVTWTTNSHHLRGAAADLRLNGQPPEGESALILARVAREEGLRTLYPFDSGHVELAGAGTGPDAHGDGPPPRAVPPSATRPPRGVAVPAPVARPATPATPATPGGDAVALGPVDVAPDPAGLALGATGVRVDGAGRVGGTGDAEAPSGAPAPGRATEPSMAGEALAHRRTGPADSARPSTPEEGGGERDPGHRAASSAQDVSRPKRRASAAGSEAEAAPKVPSPSALLAEGPGPRPPGPQGRGDAASQGNAPGVVIPPEPPAEPTGPRMVRVPLEAGAEEGALRVGVRNGRVHAEVQVGDPGLADRLMRNVHEIRQSLGERGLDMGMWSVRVAASAEGHAARNGDAGSGDGFTDPQPGHRFARDRPGERERNARHGRNRDYEGEA